MSESADIVAYLREMCDKDPDWTPGVLRSRAELFLAHIDAQDAVIAGLRAEIEHLHGVIKFDRDMHERRIKEVQDYSSSFGNSLGLRGIRLDGTKAADR